MINQLEITFVARQAVGFAALQNIAKYLVGLGPDYVDWAISHLDRIVRLAGQRQFTSGGDGFHEPHGGFVGRSTDISCANVVEVSLDSGEVAIDFDPLDPVFRAS